MATQAWHGGKLGDRFQVADDLYVEFVEIAAVKEQDINAQVMQPRHMERLAENIRTRGGLEQLPYGHRPNGDDSVVEMISGHHRFRAARQAGLTVAPMLVDYRPMRKSEVIAKSIAHNELHGTPDSQILSQLVGMIDNVDDLLTTGLPEDFVPTYGEDDTNLALPHVEFNWKLVTLLFLPKGLDDFEQAVAVIDRASEIVGIADRDQFHEFAVAVHRHGRVFGVKNLAATVAAVTRTAKLEVEELLAEGVQNTHWTRLGPIAGTQAPTDAAKVVKQAIDAVAKAAGLADDDPHRKWRALELMAADYLAGTGEPIEKAVGSDVDDETAAADS